jgi:hypothetical protein
MHGHATAARSSREGGEAEKATVLGSQSAALMPPAHPQSVPMPARRLPSSASPEEAATAAGTAAATTGAGTQATSSSTGATTRSLRGASDEQHEASHFRSDPGPQRTDTAAAATAAITAPNNPSGESAAGDSNAAVPLPVPVPTAALRHRNLARFLHTDLGAQIMLNRLRTGGIFLKHGSRGAPHFRFVCCNQDLTLVQWSDLRTKKMVSESLSCARAAQVQAEPTSTSSWILTHANRIAGVVSFHTHVRSPSLSPCFSPLLLTLCRAPVVAVVVLLPLFLLPPWRATRSSR